LLAAHPGFAPAHEVLWSANFRLGKYEEAFSHAVRGLADPEVVEVLQEAYPETGYAGAMRRAAEMLVARSQQQYVSPMQVALLFAHAGDSPQVLEWLNRAVDLHDTQIVYAPMRPDFEELWDQPGFLEVMRRINLPA